MPIGTATKQFLLFPHEAQVDTIFSTFKRHAHPHLLYCIRQLKHFKVTHVLAIHYQYSNLQQNIYEIYQHYRHSGQHNYSKTTEVLAGHIYAGKIEPDSEGDRGRLLQFTNAGFQPGAQAFGGYTQFPWTNGN